MSEPSAPSTPQLRRSVRVSLLEAVSYTEYTPPGCESSPLSSASSSSDSLTENESPPPPPLSQSASSTFQTLPSTSQISIMSYSSDSDLPSVRRRSNSLKGKKPIKKRSRVIDSEGEPEYDGPQNRTKTNMKTKKQKQKAGTTRKPEKEFECDCKSVAAHKSEAECEWEQKQLQHLEISTSVMMGSQSMVKVFVGTGKNLQTFLVHKELLVLHSGLFQEILTKDREGEEQEEEEERKVLVKKERIRLPPLRLRDLYNSPDSKASSRSSSSRSKTKFGDSSPPSPSSNPTISSSTETIQTITLPDIDAILFADFKAWVYTGYMSQAFADMEEKHPELVTTHSMAALYSLGVKLHSPSLQNFVVEHLRTGESRPIIDGPSAKHFQDIWNFTSDEAMGVKSGEEDECMLRKLFASNVAANNPFEKFATGTKERKEWEKLFIEFPEISLAVHQAASSRWHTTDPWDDEFRKEYMVEEEDLAKRWEKIILRNKTKGDIAREAEAGSVKAKLEIAHLLRDEISGLDLYSDED